ncbi:MAG: PhnD/SsuA/transferrin family substrate-binding protein [bacterium]
MIASLGMYDRAEAQPSNDRLWALIRDGLRGEGLAAPDTLTRGAGAYWDAWRSDDLILSQTCGFPYRARLHGKVALIATPDFGVTLCPPGYYRSVLVARKQDPRQTLTDFDGAALAFNEDLSQSGWAAPQNHARALGISLRPALRSGGHLMSARAVAEGRAEIAAIDAVTWSMAAEWDSFAADLKVIAQTSPTPGLPYIAALGADAETLFRVIDHAIATLPQTDRAILRLRGLVRIEPETYLAVPTPPTPAELGMAD